jgi:hypothetical protein
MPNQANTAEHILNRFKGLRAQIQEGEEPVMALPGIWDGGQSAHSTACDVILTNQRIIGYYYRGFPREHIFVDSLNLTDLRNITWRQKKYEPVFREILVSSQQRKVYIRMPRQKSEELYETLHAVTRQIGNTTTTNEPEEEVTNTQSHEPGSAHPTPMRAGNQDEGAQQRLVYERENIQRPFETSPLAVMLLLIGGIILEIISVFLWTTTQSVSIGLPIFIAGFVMVIGSFLARQRLT